MAVDPSTALGQCRLRTADFGDMPYLPDSVYLQALSDNNQNVVTASKICATYILGQLAFKTHRKMGLQLEVWGAEAFQNYKEFLLLTVTNPSFADYSPIPLQSLSEGDQNALANFISDWNRNYYNGTQSQDMALTADIGPNDGGRYGPLGSTTAGWTKV